MRDPSCCHSSFNFLFVLVSPLPYQNHNIFALIDVEKICVTAATVTDFKFSFQYTPLPTTHQLVSNQNHRLKKNTMRASVLIQWVSVFSLEVTNLSYIRPLLSVYWLFHIWRGLQKFCRSDQLSVKYKSPDGIFFHVWTISYVPIRFSFGVGVGESISKEFISSCKNVNKQNENWTSISDYLSWLFPTHKHTPIPKKIKWRKQRKK